MNRRNTYSAETSRHSIRTQPGFTVIEMIFIVTILTILAIVAFVGIWGSVRLFRLNSATIRVLDDIRYAQQLARTHNSWYGIRFQVAPVNQYNVYSTDGATDTNVANPENPGQQLVINVNSVFEGVTISAVNIAGGDKVEFNPTGTPYNDMSGSPLAANGTVTLSIEGENKVIAIIKNTGKAEVQ